MSKRLITEKQERAFRLCHHDFGCLTQEEAAKEMGIDQKNISKLLDRAKKVAPQMFPIMTKLESKIYHYYMGPDSWSVEEIAEYLDQEEYTIYRALQRAGVKNLPFTPAKGRTLHPDSDRDKDGKKMDWNSIDEDIKYKF